MTRRTSKLDRLNDIDRLPTIDEIKFLGGYTHNLEHNTGYMVSLSGQGVVKPASTCTDKDWGKYYINHRTAAKETYVGVWYNADDDTFYFDVSQWVKTKAEALALGKANSQLAVYEISTGDVITC